MNEWKLVTERNKEEPGGKSVPDNKAKTSGRGRFDWLTEPVCTTTDWQDFIIHLWILKKWVCAKLHRRSIQRTDFSGSVSQRCEQNLKSQYNSHTVYYPIDISADVRRAAPEASVRRKVWDQMWKSCFLQDVSVPSAASHYPAPRLFELLTSLWPFQPGSPQLRPADCKEAERGSILSSWDCFWPIWRFKGRILHQSKVFRNTTITYRSPESPPPPVKRRSCQR